MEWEDKMAQEKVMQTAQSYSAQTQLAGMSAHPLFPPGCQTTHWFLMHHHQLITAAQESNQGPHPMVLSELWRLAYVSLGLPGALHGVTHQELFLLMKWQVCL